MQSHSYNPDLSQSNLYANKIEFWKEMIAYFSNGGLLKNLSLSIQSLFPQGGNNWVMNDFYIYCNAKIVALSPQYASSEWLFLSKSFSNANAEFSKLPPEFITLIYHCIKYDAPANHYCAIFCIEKAIEFSPYESKKLLLDIEKNKLQQKFFDNKNNNQQNLVTQQNQSYHLGSLKDEDGLYEHDVDIVFTTYENFMQEPSLTSWNTFLRSLKLLSKFASDPSPSHQKVYIEFLNKIEASMSKQKPSPELSFAKIALCLKTNPPNLKRATILLKQIRKWPTTPPIKYLENYCTAEVGYRLNSADNFEKYFELVKQVPGNSEAWRLLGFYLDKFKNNKSHEEIDRLANRYLNKSTIHSSHLIGYCFATAHALNPNAIDQARVDSIAKCITDTVVRQEILNIAYKQSTTQNTGNNNNNNNTAIPSINNPADKKSKRLEESNEVINKKSKLTHDGSALSVSQNSIFKTTNSSPALIGPVIVFNKNEALKVIDIICGENKAWGTCPHRANDLLNYFLTGKIPSAPSSMQTATSSDFYVETTIEIKREDNGNGNEYEEITDSVVCFDKMKDTRNIPQKIMRIPNENGVYDIETPSYDLESNRCRQIRALYSNLNNNLMAEARNNHYNVSVGYVCLGMCGTQVDEAGHILIYFAEKNIVWFMDPDFHSKNPKENGCIFNDLTQRFQFANLDILDKNTYGSTVFYIPCGPSAPEIELVPVKKEFNS